MRRPAALVVTLLAFAATPALVHAQTPVPGSPAPPALPALPPPVSPPLGGYPTFPPPTAPVMPDYPRLGPPTSAVPKERYSPRMMTAGVLMTVGGVVATIAGSMVTASAVEAVDVYCDQKSICLRRDDTTRRDVGSAVMIGGAIVGAVGFPLWLFGGRMVPVRAPAAPPSRAASAELRVGAGQASVAFAF